MTVCANNKLTISHCLLLVSIVFVLGLWLQCLVLCTVTDTTPGGSALTNRRHPRVIVFLADDRLPQINLRPDTGHRFNASKPPSEFFEFACLASIAYAKRHGYALRNEPDPPNNELTTTKRKSTWLKAAWLFYDESLLSDHDYVVLIDSDASFSDQSMSLIDALDKFAPGFVDDPLQLLVANEDRAGYAGLNAGFLVFKAHSPWTRELVRQWWWDGPTTMWRGWPTDQGVLNTVIRTRMPHALRIVPRFDNDSGPFYGPEGTFVRHVTRGWSSQERLDVMRRIYESTL